jgi:hypothetical protein
LRNAGLVAMALAAACTAREAAAPPVTTTSAPAAEEPIVVAPDHHVGLDDTLLVGQPIADGTMVFTVALPDGIVDRRLVEGDGGLAAGALEVASPDGLHVAAFEERSVRIDERSFPMRGVGRVVGGLVWSPDSEAVYFLAAVEEGSADRIIGIAVGGSPQTVATFNQRGFYGLAVV